jgi:hypothetical protein
MYYFFYKTNSIIFEHIHEYYCFKLLAVNSVLFYSTVLVLLDSCWGNTSTAILRTSVVFTLTATSLMSLCQLATCDDPLIHTTSLPPVLTFTGLTVSKASSVLYNSTARNIMCKLPSISDVLYRNGVVFLHKC